MNLRIGARDLEAIRAASASAFPEECCGLLIGARDGGEANVRSIVAAPNIADDPAHRFEIEPAALFAAHRAARETGQAVIGHYHSHPGGGAAPSAHDRDRAYGEGEIWLIVPVTADGAGDAAAHVFDGGRFQPMDIITTPAEAV